MRTTRAVPVAVRLPTFRLTGLRAAVVWFGVLLVVGCVTRTAAVRDRPLCGYLDNDDATAHVLTTCLAFRETPASVHHYLPLFTFGRPADKGVDNLPGASVRDAGGNHYYTSFPPLAFVAGYVGTGAFAGLMPTPRGLRAVSLALHLLLVLVSLGVFRRMLAEITTDRAGQWLGAVAGGGVLWTAPEGLLSYTVTFWAQHVYQLVFALLLWCLVTRRVGLGFAVVCAAACLTEWTAYVVNVGVFGLALLTGNRRAAVSAAVGTLAGGLLLIAWFASVVPVGDYLGALASRFLFRRGTPTDLVGELGRGYVASAGFFLVVPALVGLLYRRQLLDFAGYDSRLRWALGEGAKRALTSYPLTTTVLGLTAWSLAENVLCMQHAVVYTYDRLKFVYLLAVLAALLAGGLRSRSLTLGLLALGTIGLVQFNSAARHRDPVATSWLHLDEHYAGLATALAADGEPIYMPAPVRGSKLYYARRNVRELPRFDGDPADNVPRYINWLRERGVSGTVLLVLPRDDIPVTRANFPTTFPRPADVVRIDLGTGVATRLHLDTPSRP